MDSILVTGNGSLNGVIPIAGAKNACLTLMPATLLSEEPLTLTNAPRLSDIATMTQLLQSLGAEVASLQDGGLVEVVLRVHQALVMLHRVLGVDRQPHRVLVVLPQPLSPTSPTVSPAQIEMSTPSTARTCCILRPASRRAIKLGRMGKCLTVPRLWIRGGPPLRRSSLTGARTRPRC